MIIVFRGQFFLHDVLSKVSNFNQSYVCTNLAALEGYGLSLHSADRDRIEAFTDATPPINIAQNRDLFEIVKNGKKQFQFVLALEGGILNCNQPLLNNTEVKLSFDRANAAIGLLYSAYGDGVTQPTELDNTVLDIIDPYMEVEYISSPYLRNFYAQIVDRPITMKYDDCNIYMKTINKGQSMIRVNNIMGGLTPDYLFAGFVRTDALNGDFLLSSTCFADVKYKDVCITLNGMAVQGYPISMDFKAPLKLYSKFLDTIGKTKKSMASDTIGPRFFWQFYSLISHKFEGEPTNEGWIGLDIKLNEALQHDYTLGNDILVLTMKYNFFIQ